MCIQVGTLREIQKCDLKVNIAIRAVYFLLFSVNGVCSLLIWLKTRGLQLTPVK